MTNKPIKLKCPTCQKDLFWSNEFPHRPFCSARCKQIDFGDWANEENKIQGSSIFDDILSEDLDPNDQ